MDPDTLASGSGFPLGLCSALLVSRCLSQRSPGAPWGCLVVHGEAPGQLRVPSYGAGSGEPAEQWDCRALLRAPPGREAPMRAFRSWHVGAWE